MSNYAHELFLLAVNLSQYKSNALVIKVFIESLNDIFMPHTFEWIEKKNKNNATLFEVCTRTKQFGYVKHNKRKTFTAEIFALLQNAVQMLAILLEKLEQEGQLNDQKEHLQQLVEKQINDLLDKQAELQIQNDEYETLNEELRQTNEELSQLNEALLSAKEKSEKNECKLKEAQSLAHIGSWELDLITNKLTWSDEIFRIFGCNPQEFGATYDAFLNFIHPNDREFVNNSYQNHLKSKVPYNIVHRILLSNNEIKYVNERCKSEFDEQGRPLRSVGTVADITDKIKSEEILHRSNELLNTVINATPVAIIGLDLDGNVKDVWNPAAEKLLGWSSDEAMGKLLPSVQKEKQEEFKSFREKIKKGHTLNGIEVQRQKRDGTLLDYSIYASPLHDSLGNIIGKIAVMIDISEHKKIEKERLSNIRFFECMDKINRIIQSKNDVELMMSEVLDEVLNIFDCDRAFLLYPCNPTAKSWTVPMERFKSEFPGAQAFCFDVPMDGDVANTLQLLLDSNGVVKFGPGTNNPLPINISKQFGIKCFMSLAIYPKVGEPWQLGVHQCSHVRYWQPEEERLLQEIGRRLADALGSFLAFRNLRESEERYRMVFENSPVAIWEEDFSDVKSYLNELKNQGIKEIETYFIEHPEAVQQSAVLARIVDVNQATLSLHEAKSKDELLTGLLQTFTQESFNTFKQELTCLWDGKTKMTMDAVVKTLAGKTRDVTISFSVCPGFEETLSKVLVSLIDITDRKQAEEKLQKMNIELEQHVTNRTSQLEAANKELEAFAYSVSHDLRAPLRSIDGFSQILIEEHKHKLDAQGQNCLTRIRNAAQHMSQLIDDMLKLSKVTRSEMNFQKVNLSFMVNEIANDLLNSETVRIVEFIIQDNIVVNADDRLIRILIRNLIDNALKFTSKHPKAKIEFGMQLQDEREVYFVRDDGAGFEMKYAEKLFGAFQRLHGSTEFSGTGIGLATVQRIINRHGGEVWAEGAVEKGATFYFTIS